MKKIYPVTLFLLITILLITAIDFVNLINNGLLQKTLNMITFIGIILIAILSRKYYGFLIGFSGCLAGTLIKKALFAYFYPDFQTTLSIFKCLMYGLYFIIIGTLYKKTVEEKLYIKNIILFSISLFFTHFFIGYGMLLTDNPKLFVLYVFDINTLFYLLIHSMIAGCCILSILLIKYYFSIINGRKIYG